MSSQRNMVAYNALNKKIGELLDKVSRAPRKDEQIVIVRELFDLCCEKRALVDPRIKDVMLRKIQEFEDSRDIDREAMYAQRLMAPDQ